MVEKPSPKIAAPRVVVCPKCGAEVPVGYVSGRQPLGVAVNIICDTLRATRSVKDAAEELGCSRGYIYKVLKAGGLTAKEVIG